MKRGRSILGLLSLALVFTGSTGVRAATLTVTANHGSVTVNPAKTLYDTGEAVELIARPDTGYSFTGWSGDAHGKRLVLKFTMDGNKNIVANFSPWTAPLGIPTPDFGILETPRMYEGKTYDFGSGPQPYKEAGNGPYTHYIDNTDPNATDTSNPYGTASKPRKTIPGDLRPGSVVEVHGGPYTYGTLSGSHYWTWFSGTGTAANPIFIRGVGLQIPRFDKMNLRVGGSYLVIENLDLNDSTIGLYYSRVSDHISMRSLEVHGGPVSYGTAVGVGQGTYVVVYNNYIHNNGDPNAADENDFHGVSAGYRDGRHAEHVWIVDNHMHGNGGDSVQINSGNVALADVARYIYIGRNIMHEEGENAVDLKQCADVVVSQNLMYKFRPTQFAHSGSDGTPMVVNGDIPKENIWVLFNEIADSSNAIRSEESSYIVGNKIYDILGNPEGGGGYGILTWPASTLYILGNTMENVRRGISHQGGGTGKAVYLHDNILALAASGEFHLGLTAAVAANSSVSHNVFDSSSGQAIINWNGTATQWNLSQFQQATGQGQGCLEGDPHFTSRPTKDFHLQPTSPAIDAGISSGPVQDVLDRFQAWYGIDIRKDIETRAKPQGSAWDIGAYEYVLSASTDLAVAGVSQNSLTLTWTVPAEQGITGAPTGYDIRYAGSSITEANWGAATQVQGEPIAGAFGQQQSFTITGLNPGAMYHVALQVLDQGGHASALSNVVSATTATTGNHAPVLTPVGDRSVIEMETLTFSISATDADNDPLAYSATNLPAGATFTAATRTFTWTPTSLQRGRGRVTFQVSDAQITVAETITITVQRISNQAPVLAAVGDRSTNENTSLGFTLSAIDADGDPLTFSATSLPGGATLVNGAFQWTPNYDQAGSYPVTLTVSDGDLTDSEQITIMVGNATDQTAPSAHDFWPAADAFQVPPNTLIAMTISDDGLGVDASSVAIRINNQLVYAGNSGLYQSASGDCRRMGTPASYRYYFQPARPFDFDQHVSVTITGSDIAHNAMTPMSYQFATEMRSFGRNQPVSADGDISGRPALATDSQGNLWATWHAGPANARDIYAARRDSQLRQWNTPLRLTSVASDRCNPVLAIGPDNVLYLAWQDNRRGNWDIYASASADGSTWGDPIRVTDSNDNQVNPVIAIDQASPYHVYIAWERGNPGSRDIYLASCSSSFASKTMAQVTSDPADQTEPALAVGSDNTVYLLWTDQRNGSADIYGSSSAASSWSNMAVVTGPGNQSHPAVAAAPGTSALHVVWQSDAAGSLDVLYGTSTGLPASPFLGSSLIDDTTGADQIAPSIVAARDYAHSVHVYACWQDNRAVSGTQDSDLYVAEIRSGTSGTNILVGDDETNSNQSDPALGYDEYGQPAVVWTDSRGSVPRIYSACSIYFKPVALASALIARAAGGRVGVDPAAINGAGDVSIQIPSVPTTATWPSVSPRFRTCRVSLHPVSRVMRSAPAACNSPCPPR